MEENEHGAVVQRAEPITEIKSLDDINAVYGSGAVARYLVKVSRIWITKSKLGGDKKQFGVGLKCHQIVIEKERVIGSSSPNDYSNCVLGDDNTVQLTESKTTTETGAENEDETVDGVTGEEVVEEAAEEAVEEEAEEEPEPEPVKPAPKAAAKVPAKTAKK